MIRGAAILLGAGLVLGGCGEKAEHNQPPTAAATPPQPSPTEPSAEAVAALSNKDCRTVAQAYSGAIRRGAFAYAAQVWNDPVIDDARLAALFSGYAHPAIAISKVEEDGAAGSLFCTVTGTLSDEGKPQTAPSQGQIVLRRVNDVPGATVAQLRWTIQSSSFIEDMQKSSRGSPN